MDFEGSGGTRGHDVCFRDDTNVLFACIWCSQAIFYGRQKRLQKTKKQKKSVAKFAALWAPKHGNSALRTEIAIFCGRLFFSAHLQKLG